MSGSLQAFGEIAQIHAGLPCGGDNLGHRHAGGGLVQPPQQRAACAGAAIGEHGCVAALAQRFKAGHIAGLNGGCGHGLVLHIINAFCGQPLLHLGKIGLAGLFAVGAVADYAAGLR